MIRFKRFWACLTVLMLATSAQAQSADFTESQIAAAPVCKKGRDVAPGDVLLCTCKKRTTDWFIWGSGPYSGHSDICTAARHAGVLGQDGGALSVFGRDGQDSYDAVERNGIASRKWGRYSSSFDVTLAGATAQAAACGTFDAGAAPYDCACSKSALASGSVWGSGPYTGDSSLCVAARHAGIIDAAGGTITVAAAPGQTSYSGSSQNGVTTSDWGSYPDSFKVSARAAGMSGEVCGALPAGDAPYACTCRADTAGGSVWGSGPYTADSNICAAAVHAGVIPASGGAISVLRLGGLPGYTGSTANGITTESWAAFEASIMFDRN